MTYPQPGPDPVASGSSVLVVDDHPANLVTIESVLAPLTLTLVMVGSGEAALRWLHHNDCALMLLDVQMPGLDGLATAELVRKDPARKHIPIVFLTAFGADQERLLRAYRAGAADYLVKPFDPHALRAKVQIFVDLHVAIEDLKRRAALVADDARLAAQELIARAEAEAALRVREEVVRRVSQDLRPPLSTIVTAIERALQEVGEQPARRRRLELVRLAAERLYRHLDDLVDLTRLEAGQLHLERHLTTASRLVTEAAEVARAEAEVEACRAGLVVEDATGGQRVPCDGPRVLRALTALVLNSMRRAGDGHVLLRASVQAGHVAFSVVDAGLGVTERERGQLFSQAWHDRTGAGLGLTLGRGIVEAHGGRLTIGAGPDAGSAFTLALPI